jgi:type IV pilus assembly protein PilO
MAFDLNEKPWYVALLIGVVLGVVLYLVMNSYVFKPIRQDISTLNESIAKLQREIQKGRAAKRDLPKLEEEIRNLELELDRLRRILPTRRETDTLLKKLKQLTEIGHFQLGRFTPQPFIDRDFYWEWPINVSLSGTYHELGLFFDRLSRFSRIINVSNLKIVAMHKRGSPFTIKADFTQQTFIYKEEKEGAPASGEAPQ